MAWSYKREEQQFEQVPVGKHRIRIKSAEKAISKSSGNDMLALQFEVSGMSNILYHYIVFLDDRPEITNRMLTSFFDAFPGIAEGDFNMQHWIGKVGACMVNVDKNDPDRTRLSYFIKADKQEDLPPWRNSKGEVVAIYAQGFEEMPEAGQDEDFPF